MAQDHATDGRVTHVQGTHVRVTPGQVTRDRAARGDARARAGSGAGRRGRFWLWFWFWCWLGAGPGLAGSAAAWRVSVVQGPVVAEVLEVLDGDTMEVMAEIWLNQKVTNPGSAWPESARPGWGVTARASDGWRRRPKII